MILHALQERCRNAVRLILSEQVWRRMLLAANGCVSPLHPARPRFRTSALLSLCRGATSDLVLPARSCTDSALSAKHSTAWPSNFAYCQRASQHDAIQDKSHDQQRNSAAMTPDSTLMLTCAGAFQGRVPVSSYSISVRDLRAQILEAISAQASDPILDVKLIVSGRNLTVSLHVSVSALLHAFKDELRRRERYIDAAVKVNCRTLKSH